MLKQQSSIINWFLLLLVTPIFSGISQNCNEGSNLSLNSSISSYSNQQNATNSTSNILDGSNDTRWSVEGLSNYAIIDLGSEYNVNQIVLSPYKDRAYQFIVEGSTLSETSGFTTLVDASDNEDDISLINRSFETTNVRYVKLTITGAFQYSGDWTSIHFFNILCSGDVVSPPVETCTEGSNLSLNADLASFSSEENPTNGAANILDGNTDNRWSAEGFPQNTVIDLGAEYDVNKINLVPYKDRAYQFTVEGALSNTGSFSTLVDATNNTFGGSLINKTFETATVRFVKLTITGASGYTGDWSSVKDFQVICAGDDIETNNYLSVSTLANFAAKGANKSVTVTSNVDWTVSESISWISVNTNNGSNDGSFNVTTTENTSTNLRTGTLNISGGGVTKTISVTQAPKQITTPIVCTGGMNLAVNATIIDFSSEQNAINGIANLIDGNTTGSNRWSGEFFPQYAVIDLGNIYTVDEINLMPYAGRAYQFLVEGSATSAVTGFSTLTDATNNTSGESILNRTFTSQNVRYVKLTITGASGYTGDWSSISEFQVICAGDDVEQEADFLSVTNTEDFDANEETQTINVSSNVEWTVSDNASWINVSETNGTNDGSFQVSVSENTTTQSRSAIVSVLCDSMMKTVEINQNAADVVIVNPTGLDPNAAPSSNFDLSQWYLSVPIDRGDGNATSIDVDELNDGYELKNVGSRDYFYTGVDGGMVFVNYPKDAPKTSANTTYSRNELREMLYGDDASTKDAENNWYFSSSNDIPDDAGGIDGVLTATLAVNRVTTTATSDVQQGRIIVGQIHASSNEPNRIYYHKLPEHDKGAIYVAHETYDGDEVFFNIIGNYVEETGGGAGDLNDNVKEPSDGIKLGEKFSYEIKIVGNDQWVTISREGKKDITEYIDMSESGYENDWMYFKAGVYSQNKTCQSDNDYDQVTFYALKQTHDNGPSAKSIDALNDNVVVFPNPFNDVVNVSFLDTTIVPVVKVRIIDALGQVITSKTIGSGDNKIQLTGNFSTGLYFIQLLDISDNVIAMKKAINE